MKMKIRKKKESAAGWQSNARGQGTVIDNVSGGSVPKKKDDCMPVHERRKGKGGREKVLAKIPKEKTEK